LKVLENRVGPDRKAVDDEIQSLKRRKLELLSDIDSLTASADQLAERAESSRDMSILVTFIVSHGLQMI